MPDPYADYQVMKRAWIPQMHRRSPPIITIKSTRDFDDGSLEFLQPSPIFQEKIVEDERLRHALEANVDREGPQILSFRDIMDIYPLIKFLNDNYLTPSDLRSILSPESYDQLER